MKGRSIFKEHIQELIRCKVLFATYRLPNEKEAKTIIQYKPSLHSFNKAVLEERSGFVMHPFNEDTSPVIWIEADEIIVDDNFGSILNNIERDSSSIDGIETGNIEPIDKEAYKIKVKSLIKELKIGSLNKVVFSRIIPLETNNIDLPDSFLDLAQKFPEAFVFMVNVPGEEIWLGASPESLLRIKGNNASTMALAGTQYTDEISDTWTDKNLEEQSIVQEHIESCLFKNKIRFEKEETATKKLSSGLSHLITPYTFSIEKNQILPVIHSLHPTPAVCGQPTSEAKRWILNNEGYDRKYYTGFLGPMNIDHSSDLFVNLRSASFGNQSKLYVGGGIIQESDEENEWNESEQKSRTILDVVGSQVKI